MCLIIERFDVNEFGALIEVGQCGHRRAIRGRTFDDIAREDAAQWETVKASLSDLPALYQRERQRPCAWPGGCDGFTTTRVTEYCHAHVEERRRLNMAEYHRRRRLARKAAK